MSDRTRSPDEIEGEISRRQEELADDLEDLEYRLSRRGVKEKASERLSSTARDLADRANSLKEQATDRASSAAHTMAERASSLKDQAAERARQLRSEAEDRINKTGRRAADRAEDNRATIATIAGGLAIALGLYFALRSSGDREARGDPWRSEYATVGPAVATRSFQYYEFGDY